MTAGRQLLLVVLVALLTVLAVARYQNTAKSEGFTATATRTDEPEDRMTAEAFSFNVLQSVKGPIKRLSATLLDMGAWRERIDLARLTPVELARRNLTAK